MAGISRNEGHSGSKMRKGVFIYMNKLGTVRTLQAGKHFLHLEDLLSN